MRLPGRELGSPRRQAGGGVQNLGSRPFLGALPPGQSLPDGATIVYRALAPSRPLACGLPARGREIYFRLPSTPEPPWPNPGWLLTAPNRRSTPSRRAAIIQTKLML